MMRRVLKVIGLVLGTTALAAMSVAVGERAQGDADRALTALLSAAIDRAEGEDLAAIAASVRMALDHPGVIVAQVE